MSRLVFRLCLDILLRVSPEPTSNVSGVSFLFRVIDTRSSVAFLSCLLKQE